ncbi:hypothetical protein [Sphingorhabdus sp. SMR4y]|uniref:hypothetical protein n=1 Tax=Sphingorhabdus sp. SMR4y TaxID=2584094 RepID=UPI000B5F70AD|nr:hypothetical protein [Sphingorhabdus sp. SMR4y]ASK88497.1 hypothetical protein SPHFLASMR4Y_01750 [Sphingorhabdus sp. SMR4y]
MKFDFWRLLPPYWMQNQRTDYEWDSALSAAIDRFGVEEVNYYLCRIGGVAVWIQNYPYAYGSMHNGGVDFLPTVSTRKKLRKAVAKARITALPEGWQS